MTKPKILSYFEEHFICWAQTLINKSENEFVSIDGKTIRHA